MVLSTRSSPLLGLPRCEATRTLALAIAIAVNAMALLLLSLPGEGPALRLPTLSTPSVLVADWIRPRPPEPIPEQVPAPPRPALRPQAAAPAKPVLPTAAPIATIAPAVVELDAGTLPAVASSANDLASPGATAADSDAQLAYGHAPPPRYPAIALRLGLEGTVTLAVLVAADGSVEQVRLQRSSGHRQLDQQALRHVREHWRFQPAIRDGRAVSAWASVPVQFRISD